MLAKHFWTEKRRDAVSKVFLTLFQAFVIGGLLGGAWEKINLLWLKVSFIVFAMIFFLVGIFLAEPNLKKNKEKI